jgi:hypothetical protein
MRYNLRFGGKRINGSTYQNCINILSVQYNCNMRAAQKLFIYHIKCFKKMSNMSKQYNIQCRY